MFDLKIPRLTLSDETTRYYSLFIASNLAAAVFYFFFLPETSGKTLEEIGALFGDEVVTRDTDKVDGLGEQAVHEEQPEKRV
jgi:hypothetical protein